MLSTYNCTTAEQRNGTQESLAKCELFEQGVAESPSLIRSLYLVDKSNKAYQLSSTGQDVD